MDQLNDLSGLEGLGRSLFLSGADIPPKGGAPVGEREAELSTNINDDKLMIERPYM